MLTHRQMLDSPKAATGVGCFLQEKMTQMIDDTNSSSYATLLLFSLEMTSLVGMHYPCSVVKMEHAQNKL